MQRERAFVEGLLALAVTAFLMLSGMPNAQADYWDGRAPFCNGNCSGGSRQIGSSKCGDGACCWTGHKALCSSGTAACLVKETNSECFGVVEVCDNGSYSAPNNVWHSCDKYVCGACFGFSLDSFIPNKCKSGFEFRGAVMGDEICVSPASHQRVVADNAAAAGRRAPSGDACKQGFVWREATPTDHVCVVPQTRTETAAETAAEKQNLQQAGLPYGPDTCKPGFVWREAITNDHVCVTPQTRALAKQQNAESAARHSPTGGAYGADTCKEGFVWREVIPADHVCVPPAERTEAAADSRAAHDRRATK